MRRLIKSGVLTVALVTSCTIYADLTPNISFPAIQTKPELLVPNTQYQWIKVPTQFISAGGVEFAYRELGKENAGPPLIFLNHLAGVLDNGDPRIIDGFARTRHIVVFDNRGVGATSGKTADTISKMADDAITFITAKGFEKVDLLGFSMGGMVSQEIALKKPKLVRKMILAGTAPAGGEGINTVSKVSNLDLLRGLVTFQDPKQYLFFTRTSNGIEAGKDFLKRINERVYDRDTKISFAAYRTQLKALKKWGNQKPADLSVIQQPVLVVNGEKDRMVPIQNTYELAKRLPHSTLIVYPDAGHGGIFQFHQDFVKQSLSFLEKN